MYKILISRTFQKQFRRLPAGTQERIRLSLSGLEEDPFNPRPGTDVKPLRHTSPQKYRLRVGGYRVIYTVEGDTVRVVDVMTRGREYSGVCEEFVPLAWIGSIQ
ncbi:type II toxin-antitoxin system RelE/ParE family toxin [Methanofollis formosanus]|uniref:Type II toxin-antitoxin system RelE/ParE family toxin n=1 Tax=Methanofollis formosanus TaxID=299308 RepID=A0A8G1EGR4_9EURY|nr:type II toxin-antitoxin system RelE/ParE family toxin [Methanofollis formosanus]QYZ79202.1 type II toxin-antitoxin system RelE/ParE family toxin [Methanofollis formosanus]